MQERTFVGSSMATHTQRKRTIDRRGRRYPKPFPDGAQHRRIRLCERWSLFEVNSAVSGRSIAHGPNLCLYSVEEMNAFTISALTKFPLKTLSFVSQKS